VNEASIGGGITGFVGRGGQDIDDIFAGGFFPNDNLVIDLQQQLVDASIHRDFTDKKTPKHKTEWEYLETNLEYDDVIEDLDNKKYKNDSDKMKEIEKYDNYDRVEKKDVSVYKNETNEWKPIISLSDIYEEI
jgi:hypothetical protein